MTKKPLSPPEAVLLYARDFLPSWAGAISIDLLPAVLIMIMTVVEGQIRRDGGVDVDAEAMSAADMMRAVHLFRQIEGEFGERKQDDVVGSSAVAGNVAHLNVSKSQHGEQAGD